ncbi:hypothetical protein ACEPAF_9120 [Sanghuangporus sanghuang]
MNMTIDLTQTEASCTTYVSASQECIRSVPISLKDWRTGEQVPGSGQASFQSGGYRAQYSALVHWRTSVMVTHSRGGYELRCLSHSRARHKLRFDFMPQTTISELCLLLLDDSGLSDDEDDWVVCRRTDVPADCSRSTRLELFIWGLGEFDLGQFDLLPSLEHRSIHLFGSVLREHLSLAQHPSSLFVQFMAIHLHSPPHLRTLTLI